MTIWNPAEYAHNSAAQLEWANEMLSRLDLKGSEAVLDLGCGDGKITRPWRTNSRGGRAVGIGNSEATIRYAQAHHAVSEHKNLAFREPDVRTLDYADGFDLPFSSFRFTRAEKR